MSTSDNFQIEVLVQQKESPISKHFLDEIRPNRREAKSNIKVKVSPISSNNLKGLVYQRRNALIKEKSILNSLDQNFTI